MEEFNKSEIRELKKSFCVVVDLPYKQSYILTSDNKPVGLNDIEDGYYLASKAGIIIDNINNPNNENTGKHVLIMNKDFFTERDYKHVLKMLLHNPDYNIAILCIEFNNGARYFNKINESMLVGNNINLLLLDLNNMSKFGKKTKRRVLKKPLFIKNDFTLFKEFSYVKYEDSVFKFGMDYIVKDDIEDIPVDDAATETEESYDNISIDIRKILRITESEFKAKFKTKKDLLMYGLKYMEDKLGTIVDPDELKIYIRLLKISTVKEGINVTRGQRKRVFNTLDKATVKLTYLVTPDNYTRGGFTMSPHERSGHWRNYKSGKKVWVNKCYIHENTGSNIA